MAIYHLSAKIVSRSTGRSSVAAAAYRSGNRLTDKRTGQDHNYTAKRDIEHSEIVAPDNAPDWMRDREKLWNSVELVEKRRDAQLAREIEVALPRELTTERHIELVREFAQTEFVDHGMVVDFNIHNGRAQDGNEQPHCHLLLTTRELMGEGFGPKNREWNSVDKLEGWRSRWADHCNAELERGGHDVRIDHRTLEAQRAEAERQARHARDAGNTHLADQHEERAIALDREPEPKLGVTASQMEKLGHISRRGDERREAEARNAERRTLHEQARELSRQIAEVTREVVEDARRRLHELAERFEKAYCVVRERAEALTRRAVPEREQPSKTIVAGPAPMLSGAARDALLGRTKPITRNAGSEIGRDDLLGQNSEKGSETDTPDVAALLGRGLRTRPSIKDRSRDGDDFGR